MNLNKSKPISYLYISEVLKQFNICFDNFMMGFIPLLNTKLHAFLNYRLDNQRVFGYQHQNVILRLQVIPEGIDINRYVVEAEYKEIVPKLVRVCPEAEFTYDSH